MTDKKDKTDYHFLVVDDDIGARTMTVDYLKSLGFEKITEANDGEKAIELLEKDSSINFVISDWQMPNLDGLSLLQHLRTSKSKAQLPFLIVTSPISEEAEKIMMAAENLVNAYIIKPFRSDLLKQKIDQIVQMSVHGPHKQVVLVDDDENAREVVKDYLVKLGFRDIEVLNDGKQALEYLISNSARIGLIVSDWDMPELTGIDLLRSCKARAELSAIPFLMITSQTSMEKMKVMQAAKSHVDKYLLKPFSLNELKERIDTLLVRSVHFREVSLLIAEGSEHLEYGRYQKAQECFEEALKIDPINDVALRGMGDAVGKLRDPNAALVYYKKALESNPLSLKSCLRLANSYEKIGWIDKAITVLQESSKRLNFSPELHFQLGRLFNKKGETSAAKGHFEKTLELQLDHREARLMLEMLNSSRRS
ncbi:MAG: hypothetical protein A3K03_07945 [Bdellovibrionales bacterium RIFOXYD1_FULL_44_7]|nr:MAG: hypothetical protein A3K03_07945 [Bdellovibrionales bacterium RIFOXYD1_FULL_44_7]